MVDGFQLKPLANNTYEIGLLVGAHKVEAIKQSYGSYSGVVEVRTQYPTTVAAVPTSNMPTHVQPPMQPALQPVMQAVNPSQRVVAPVVAAAPVQPHTQPPPANIRSNALFPIAVAQAQPIAPQPQPQMQQKAPTPTSALQFNGFSSNYSTTSTPYQPTISLSGSGFNTITQISWTCAMPNGASCGAILPWTSANWNGKFIRYSDTSAVIAPMLLIATDLKGTYHWTATFYGAGQVICRDQKLESCRCVSVQHRRYRSSEHSIYDQTLNFNKENEMAAEQNVQPVLKTRFYYLLLLTVLGLSACSGDPSVSDAKKTLETEIAGQAEGMVKLVDFEKTNGVKHTFEGRELYTLEYSATFEFQQASWKECDPFQGCFGNFHFRNVAPTRMEAAVLPFKHFDAGSKVKTSGKIIFEKTEKGWRGVRERFNF